MSTNWFSFESLRLILGEPMTVNPAFSWHCGCWAAPIPGTEDSLSVTPCKAHRRRIEGD